MKADSSQAENALIRESFWFFFSKKELLPFRLPTFSRESR
jgi:hypothetical protein